MNFSESICHRLKQINDAFTVVVNDQKTGDGMDEECAVLPETNPVSALFVRRLHDDQVVIYQWHNIGSLRIVVG